MSTRAQRQHRRAIRASGESPTILFEAAGGIDWIQAAGATGESPKGPPKFSMVAYTGGPMLLNGYDLPLIVDLAGLTIPEAIPILKDHELGGVVGHGTATSNGSTLKATGIISGAGPAAVEIVASAAKGFPWKVSVGVLPSKREYVAPGQQAEVNGKSVKGPLYIARKGLLREISFVAVAADGRTSSQIAAVAAVTSQRKELSMEFTQWIQALGVVDFDNLPGASQEKYHALYDAEVKAAAAKAADEIKAAGTPAKPVVEAPRFDIDGINLCHARHQVGIEAKAIEYAGKIDAAELATINAAGMKAAIEAKAKAINESWATPRLEVELVKAQANYEVALIRAERPKGPAIHASTRDLGQPVIEAAMAQALNLPKIETHYDEKTLQAAHTAFRGRLGLQQVLIMAAAANGFVCRPGERVHQGNCREVLRYAMIEAASVYSLPGLLSNVANKELLTGFTEEDQTWREIAAVKSVSDFKTVTAYRMLDDFEYEELPPDGTIKHGTISEESFTRKAKTYAKMFALPRTDIINDDLGALDDLRTRLGRGAAQKFNAVFWAKFISNSSFFTAARANYITGATTNLGTDGVGLALGVAGFDDMRSTAVAPAKTGKRIGGTAAILLVPPQLEAIALQLYTPIAAAETAKVNVWASKYRPVKVNQLSDSNFTGWSATAWFLLRNPAILAAMVVSFLNNVQTPIVESADADFDTLGIQFRGYHDFGCDQAEWLAGVKSKGAA